MSGSAGHKGRAAATIIAVATLAIGLIGGRADAQSTYSQRVGPWTVACGNTPTICFGMIRSPGDNANYATISLFASSNHSAKVKFTAKPIWGVKDFTVSFGGGAAVGVTCEAMEPNACTLSQADSDRFIEALAASHVVTLHVVQDYTIFSNGFGPMSAALTDVIQKNGHPDFQMSWPVASSDQAVPETGAWCQTPIGGCAISPAPNGGDCTCPTPAGRVPGWVKQAN